MGADVISEFFGRLRGNHRVFTSLRRPSPLTQTYIMIAGAPRRWRAVGSSQNVFCGGVQPHVLTCLFVVGPERRYVCQWGSSANVAIGQHCGLDIHTNQSVFIRRFLVDSGYRAIHRYVADHRRIR